MAWITPAISTNRAGSTGPGLRRMAMATRSPPGMGWASKPRDSILATTASDLGVGGVLVHHDEHGYSPLSATVKMRMPGPATMAG